MLAQILFCGLAAAGALLLCWCLAAALLFPDRDTVAVVPASGDGAGLEQAARRRAWLRGAGLAEGRFVILDLGLNERGRELARRLCGDDDTMECLKEAELPGIWKMER